MFRSRRRSLRQANLTNRFNCLQSDDDSSSVTSCAPVDPSPTNQLDSILDNPSADIDDLQSYRDFSAISPAFPRPVNTNHHQSFLLLFSVDKSHPTLPSTSISSPLSSDVCSTCRSSRNCTYRTHTSQ